MILTAKNCALSSGKTRTSYVYLLFFRKRSRKTKKKQVDALTSLNLSRKIEELKHIECVSPRNQLKDLIIDKVKEIKQLQNNTELGNLGYTKKGKNYGFCKYSLPILFWRDIHGENFSLENADKNNIS